MKTIKPGSKANRAFQLDSERIDVEARTVELSFSSEIPARRWFGDEILDHSSGSVRLGRFQNGAPLLIDHNNSVRTQPGIIESVSIGADRVGRAVVRFGKSAADDEIFQKVQDGIIRNVSVGYIVHRAVLEQESDEGDTYRIMDWEPLEASLVSVPLDPSVGVGRSMEPGGLELIEIKSEVKRMAIENETVPVDMQAINKEANERAATAERKRSADIMSIGSEYAERGGVELAAKAIADGVDVQAFQRSLLDLLKTKPVAFDQGAKVEENIEKDGMRGFKSFGQFCKFVRADKLNLRTPEFDQIRAATSFASTTSGEDGAILIPPTFSREVDRIAFEEGSLLSLINPTPIEGNSMTYPRSDATPWGSTGVQAYWEGEAGTITPSKPGYKKNQLDLHKLTALVNVTNEMLEDASAMSVEIPRDMGIAVDWKVQNAIVNGTGAGMPLGIMAADCTVSQAKEGSQTATTINAQNVSKMLGRVIKEGGGNIVWLANPDAMNQVHTMTLGNNVIWTSPNSGFKDAPSGLLMGRPIIETEACQTLGTVGDIILVNLSGYRAITKSGGMRLDRSMHLYFDQDLESFKLVFRLDARPRLQKAVTPPNSSVTKSHFVTLATRS